VQKRIFVSTGSTSLDSLVLYQPEITRTRWCRAVPERGVTVDTGDMGYTLALCGTAKCRRRGWQSGPTSPLRGSLARRREDGSALPGIRYLPQDRLQGLRTQGLRPHLLQSSKGERQHQKVGIRQIDEQIWLVSVIHYAIGFFDDQTCRLEPAPNPSEQRCYLCLRNNL
jgi:hypothetical protein